MNPFLKMLENNKAKEESSSVQPAIEEESFDYIEEIEKKLEEKSDMKTEEDSICIPMSDFFKDTEDDYTSFDEYCYNKGDGYKLTAFPGMSEHLEGIESGLYILAAESNCGKTAFMLNILTDLTSHPENKLFGIYFSLDDSKNEIIPRIIAMNQEIPIGVASKPKRFENMLTKADPSTAALIQEQLEKRRQGIEDLKSTSDKFKILDTDKIQNTTDIQNYIERIQTYVKSIDPDMNIAVAIDALNDVVLDKSVYGRVPKDEQMGEIAKCLKDISKKFDVFMITSCHLRKLNGNRRPTLDDLRDANTLVYEASVVWLLFNDVSKNKGNAKIYFDDSEADGRLGAVIEMDWGKNKKSSYKGRTFYKFRPFLSKLVECKTEESKRYDALIMQS